jgi:hypothetical protein
MREIRNAYKCDASVLTERTSGIEEDFLDVFCGLAYR